MLAEILHETALLEDAAARLITVCFLENITSRSVWTFVHVVLGDVTPGDKIDKLKRVLKKMHSELYEDFAEQNLLKRMDVIRKLRNIFAHSVLHTQVDHAAKRRTEEIALFNPRYEQPHIQIKLEDFTKKPEDATRILTVLENYLKKTVQKKA